MLNANKLLEIFVLLISSCTIALIIYSLNQPSWYIISIINSETQQEDIFTKFQWDNFKTYTSDGVLLQSDSYRGLKVRHTVTATYVLLIMSLIPLFTQSFLYLMFIPRMSNKKKLAIVTIIISGITSILLLFAFTSYFSLTANLKADNFYQCNGQYFCRDFKGDSNDYNQANGYYSASQNVNIDNSITDSNSETGNNNKFDYSWGPLSSFYFALAGFISSMITFIVSIILYQVHKIENEEYLPLARTSVN